MTVRHAYVHGSPDGADETLMRASDWNADHVVDVFAPTGLTGAVTAARFVGGTTSGAPVTGTFAAGDYVVAQDGKLWACSSAGSPGTWAQIGGASDVAMLASGSGSSRLPGIEVADRAPASPSAYDDEFEDSLFNDPTPVATAQDTYSDWYASKMLDSNDATTWASYDGGTPKWVTVDLGIPIAIDGFRLLQADGYYATSYKVRWSNDNSTWTDGSTYASSGGDETKSFGSVTARYWGLVALAESISGWHIFTLDFHRANGLITSGWTVLGSPDILNTSDIPSNVHMRVNSSAYQLDGIYKAMPTPPFTMTVKFSDYRFVSQYNAYTIGVGHSDGNNPWWVFGNVQVNDYGLRTDWFTALWSNRTTRSAVADTNTGGYMQRYMRMIVTSATDIVCQRSHGGLVWVTSRTSTNPTFTPTKIGIFMTGYTSIPVEASIDWIRFSS